VCARVPGIIFRAQFTHSWYPLYKKGWHILFRGTVISSLSLLAALHLGQRIQPPGHSSPALSGRNLQNMISGTPIAITRHHAQYSIPPQLTQPRVDLVHVYSRSRGAVPVLLMLLFGLSRLRGPTSPSSTARRKSLLCKRLPQRLPSGTSSALPVTVAHASPTTRTERCPGIPAGRGGKRISVKTRPRRGGSPILRATCPMLRLRRSQSRLLLRKLCLLSAVKRFQRAAWPYPQS